MRAYVGLDLAASASRCSGFAYILCSDACILAEAKCLYSDEEVLGEVLKLSRAYRVVVSLDAPFSIGRGIRAVDRKMMSLGFKVLPPGFRAMRALAERAIGLVRRLAELGVAVYETHPRSALLSSRCSSAGEVLDRLSVRYGVNVNALGKDLRDAVIAAAVSYCTDLGCSLSVEDADGTILLIKRLC